MDIGTESALDRALAELASAKKSFRELSDQFHYEAGIKLLTDLRNELRESRERYEATTAPKTLPRYTLGGCV